MRNKRKVWMLIVGFGILLIATNIMTYSLKDNRVLAVEKTGEQKTKSNLNTADEAKKMIGKNANVKTEKKKDNKSAVELYIKKGKTYCKVNGKKVKNKMVADEKHTYITDKNGALIKGWTKYKGEYYCLSRKYGRLYHNTTIDGIKVKKNGKAKITKIAVAKIKTMIKAKKVVNKITKPTDTRKQKLRKCFDWIAKAPYVRYRMLKPIYKNQGWEVSFANDIFDKGSGCCVSESAALAFMLHEAGYKKVYVCHDTSHAWVELNGLVYDALFARAKSWSKYYGCTYKSFGLHAVGKRKI